ncbi:hypothetical protein HG536_0C02990 [Torulaspora globosa]|uniref:Uncharacterized protein n=1 Tax=Torulaspora globosa TaxID=48254 RepID=A0A7G3ZF45_9SACH|nr:uncharacterized protein HG536_0C02990 [Torulaspora globosa]QLL32131.1 hypothetical protein HG536_0C02990 [Torulaspora globosa]
MNSYTNQESTCFYDENLILKDVYGHNDQVRNAIELSNNASLSSNEANPTHKILVEKSAVTDMVRPANEEHIIDSLESAKANVDLQNALKDSYTEKLNRRERNYIKTNEIVRSTTTSISPTSSARTCKGLNFETTRVMSFEQDEIAPKRAINSTALEKPILKDHSDKSVTYNHVDEIGKSELLTEIDGIYNICDLPQSIFNKDNAVVGHLACEGTNAFEAHEYCVERKELKLKDRDSQIERLENEVRKLTQELNELKRVPGKVDNETHVGEDSRETENSCIKCDKELEMERKNDKMKRLEIDLEEKIGREIILTEENNNLQMEVKKLKDSLLEQQNANDSLLCQVKSLDERLKTEITNSIDIRSKMWSLKRITRDNLELQSRLKAAEQTNAKLLHENESLLKWNDVLYAKADNLEDSIGDLQSCLTFSQLRYKRLETTHQEVVKERDECHTEIKSLRDTYHASKSRSDLRIEQLKEKCMQFMEDCKVRDEQIRSFEYELNLMKKTLVSSKGRMAKKKRETIIYFNTAPLMDGEDLTDNWSVAQSQIGRERQTLKPLVNKVC